MNPERYAGLELTLASLSGRLVSFTGEKAEFTDKRSGRKFIAARWTDTYDQIARQIAEIPKDAPISYVGWLRANPDIAGDAMECVDCGMTCRDCQTNLALLRKKYDKQLAADQEFVERKAAKAVSTR